MLGVSDDTDNSFLFTLLLTLFWKIPREMYIFSTKLEKMPKGLFIGVIHLVRYTKISDFQPPPFGHAFSIPFTLFVTDSSNPNMPHSQHATFGSIDNFSRYAEIRIPLYGNTHVS